MKDPLSLLIVDTIAYLRREFDPDTWVVSPSSMPLLRYAREPHPPIPNTAIDIHAHTAIVTALRATSTTRTSNVQRPADIKKDRTPPVHNMRSDPSPQLEHPSSASDLHQMRTLLMRIAPRLRLVPSPLNDQPARSAATSWLRKKERPSVLLLSFEENEDESHFLVRLMEAIRQHLCPSQIASSIEPGDRVDLILAPPQVREMRSFRTLGDTQQHFLGEIPVLLLSPLSHYLAHPPLKKQLWNKLCTLLSSSM